MPCTLSTPKQVRLAQAPAVMPVWTLLPYDNVRRVGGRLLDGNDIDSYMVFGAVCHDLCYATKHDPKNKKADDGTDHAHFKPTKWVLLERRADLVMLINVDTGRFLCKSIPLLCKFFFISATSGGLFLLDESTEPHWACVMNPFTGSIAHFKVKIPCVGMRAVAITTQLPMVVFISTDIGEIMWADQNIEHFKRFWMAYPNKPTCITSFGGNLYATHRYGSIYMSTITADVAAKEQRCHSAMNISMEEISASLDTAPDTSAYTSMKGGRYYLVESAGDLLLVTKPSTFTLDQPVVHRVNIETKAIDQVSSIGRRAFFVSHARCLSIDANKFPSIQGGCIYFVEPIVTRCYYGPLGVTIFNVADNVMTFDWSWRGCIRLFTLTQIFADYCRYIQYSKLYEMMAAEWSWDLSDEDSESDESSSSELDGEESSEQDTKCPPLNLRIE